MARYEGTAHGDVFLGPNLGVVVSPALSGIIEEANPQQIVLGSIVDHQVSIAIPLRGDHGKRRIELQNGHQKAFKQNSTKYLFGNVVGLKQFQREVTLAPDLFQLAGTPGRYPVAAIR
jgi:hypothetical protein